MQDAFFDAMADVAAADPDLLLLAGWTEPHRIEQLHEAMPDRIYTIGASEATLVGMAAGLARTDHRVFLYAPAPAVTLRVCELLRNDLCQPGLAVTVVGADAGYAAGRDGFTAHATEDVAAMRALPGMTVIVPADSAEAGAAVRALAHHDGPAYLRLGAADEAVGGEAGTTFAIGRARQLREGHDVTLIGCGSLLRAVLEAADILQAGGVSARVLNMATVAPLDTDAILAACRETRALITIEEHSVTGGLGSAVADLLAGLPAHPPLRRLGLAPTLIDHAGSRTSLLAAQGLDGKGIAASARA